MAQMFRLRMWVTVNIRANISSAIVNVRGAAGKNEGYSENSKMEYPKSLTELLRLEEKKNISSRCYFIKFLYLFKNRYVRKEKQAKCTKY
jgi:hypothetical protein